MRKLYYIGSVIAIGLALVFIFRGGYDYIKPTTGENIIVFGDSLAAGQGSTTGNDVASLLAKKTGLPVINAGVNGDTTVTSLSRLETDVLAKNPKVVVILIGGNDFFQKLSEEVTMDALRTIVEKIQATGAGVILVNENKIFGTTSEFKALAKEKQIPYMENILKGIIGDSKLMSDQIHPNDQGYEIMAEKIKPVILDYLNNE